MSVHNRQRRRPQRQNRPQHSTEQHLTDPAVAETDTYTETSPDAATSPVLPAASTRTTALLRGQNRPAAAPRSAAPPLDYSREYQHARTDLRWITLWAVILFGLMFALRFSGLV